MSKIEFSLSKLREEVKKIINEVLDERELERKMRGPYDIPEKEDE
tara:strand:- start:181 stop:315 length:135 start_codon:yes stop_codon:yes gene_type:complete